MLDEHNDHRIVMAMSVILSKTDGSMKSAEAIKKIIPDFSRISDNLKQR